MNAKKMFLSLIPWLLFTVVVQRRGANAAAIAAFAAAGLSLWFALKDRRSSSVKVIDVTGVTVFVVLGCAALAGGSIADDVANYGRGVAAVVLALVMLGSVLVVPFTEQYARESVPREYWASPVFRAVNRRISAVWGVAILVMGGCHLLAGRLDPATSASTGARPANLLLNWAVPIVLILAAIAYTNRTTESASGPGSASAAR